MTGPVLDQSTPADKPPGADLAVSTAQFRTIIDATPVAIRITTAAGLFVTKDGNSP
mgnify:CR=1 FL=1